MLGVKYCVKEEILKLITQSMCDCVYSMSLDTEIERFFKKYKDIQYLIPLESRILVGMMHSLIIKQGYLIETVLKHILSSETGMYLHAFSGKLKTSLTISPQSVICIDHYLESCQKKGHVTKQEYTHVLKDIQRYERDSDCYDDFREFERNIDLLFYCEKLNRWYILEVKFTDNQSVSQYREMCKKLLWTYAGLLHEFPKKDWNILCPALYYFQNEYIQHSSGIYYKHVYYGASLFSTLFSTITYSDVLECFQKVRETKEIQNVFCLWKDRIHNFLVQYQIY